MHRAGLAEMDVDVNESRGDDAAFGIDPPEVSPGRPSKTFAASRGFELAPGVDRSNDPILDQDIGGLITSAGRVDHAAAVDQD
jgi:hypothetical protein